MVIEMPFDLVQEVTCFFRVFASSKAYFMMRSTPLRREHRLLRHHLALGALEHAPADVAVLALGVLADHEVVDVAGLAAGERAGQALEQAHRAQVDVQVEPAPEVDQQAPGGDVVGRRSPGCPPRRSRWRRTCAGSAARRPGTSCRAPCTSRSSRGIPATGSAMPCFAPAASITRTPSGITSRPMPSPGITAILCSVHGREYS